MSNVAQLLARRERLLGPGNPLFYDNPLHLVRGEGVWLFDADGRRYLDCYNNVPCVGHCHPRVVKAICDQAGLLNTHTRYLHENILDYAERLLDTFDESLGRVMLACTGSEANDIALRMAKSWTGGEGIICTNATYHGNTEAVMAISSLFGPVPDKSGTISMVPWPDNYRNLDGLEGESLATRYAGFVADAIGDMERAGIRLAAFIACPIFANEGLPDTPGGYLAKVAAMVRDAGGVFIADEVQAGFGRTGQMWGYQGQNVVPDIVTLGKPMGNGHPVSGVVAGADLVADFREQVMYFNTFGGNPVSCAAAMAVLDVLEEEQLVDNARDTGGYLAGQLQELVDRHEIIGEVRSKGLFFAVDLVTDRVAKTPATEAARQVVNQMRECGILLSKIGEHDSVLKMRPPLPFAKENADFLVTTLDQVLGEIRV